MSAAVLAMACTAAAQSTADTVYHLHGTVLDGITGKSIGRALVTSGDRQLATMTDTEGRFHVDVSVPAAASGQQGGAVPFGSVQNGYSGLVGAGGRRMGRNYFLTAQRPGYLPDNDPASFNLDDSTDTTDLTLKLMPAAAIHGRVTAIGQDSLRGVQVMLMQQEVQDGIFRWEQRGNRQTAADGSFRFGDLQPGAYTVLTQEWAGPGGTFAETNASHEFPPQFLGDAHTLATAARLRLHAGQDELAELHLHSAPYYQVQIPVSTQQQNTPVAVRMVGSGDTGFRLGFNLRTNAIEGSLPNGNYTILVSSFGLHPASAVVPLTVADGPVMHAAIALAPLPDIIVRIHTDFTHEDANQPSYGVVTTLQNGTQRQVQQPPMNLFLRAQDDGAGLGGSGMVTADDGRTHIDNIAPGRYTVQANAHRGYIASMTAGGTDLLRQPYVVAVSGSAEPIDVTLRDDGGTLTGKLKDAPGGAPFATILLVATDGSGRTGLGFAPTQGKYTVSNLAPGSYRAFAFSGSHMQPGSIPFRDPEAMHAYDSLGTVVSVVAGQSTTMDLPLTEAIDLEGEK